MSSVYPLPLLYQAVKTRLAAEEWPTSVVFGHREATKQTNHGTGGVSRVVFEPGVDGAMGSYEPARFPGRNPRPLGCLREYATIYCWASATGASGNDESAHYEACRLLHDATYRALYRAAHEDVQCALRFSSPQWISQKQERFCGYECKFILDLEANIPDESYAVASMTASVVAAVITESIT